jgi:hypothetical protein
MPFLHPLHCTHVISFSSSLRCSLHSHSLSSYTLCWRIVTPSRRSATRRITCPPPTHTSCDLAQLTSCTPVRPVSRCERGGRQQSIFAHVPSVHVQEHSTQHRHRHDCSCNPSGSPMSHASRPSLRYIGSLRAAESAWWLFRRRNHLLAYAAVYNRGHFVQRFPQLLLRSLVVSRRFVASSTAFKCLQSVPLLWHPWPLFLHQHGPLICTHHSFPCSFLSPPSPHFCLNSIALLSALSNICSLHLHSPFAWGAPSSALFVVCHR